jgi:protein arginine kinase
MKEPRPMLIAPLLETPMAEPSEAAAPKSSVVLSTRMRFARNLAKFPFPGWAKEPQRREIFAATVSAIAGTKEMKKGISGEMSDISELEKLILFERHLISRDLMGMKAGSGFVISRDQACAVMINEEDHLRIQVIKPGFNFRRVWTAINSIDTQLEETLDFAFSPTLGYLTACPTNVGTGMRASAMMHLPALVIAGQMDKVVRAVNQLGIAVRGLFGEGSDATGSIFQISNQTTLGESEEEILKRLTAVLNTVIEQESNMREHLLEKEPAKIFDKIGRAYGILRGAYVLSSSEAMNTLSLVRLGVDMQMLPAEIRPVVDRLFMECQPGHIQYAAKRSIDSAERDILRAAHLRSEFEKVAPPAFTTHHDTNPNETSGP